MDHVQLLVDFASIAGKIGVDEVDDELCWVHVEWNWEAASVEVGLHLRDGTTVGGSTLGEQKQLVEHGKGRSGRLMYRCNYDQVVLFRNVLDEGDDLERGGRIQTRGGFVQEEKLWAGDELRRYTDTTLLTTRDTLSDGCSNQVVGLALETECSEKGLDALDTLEFADSPGERKACCEVEGLADGERSDQGIFLLNIGRDATEGLGVRG